MPTELLAETDFPAQGILFIIVMVFSFLKWLFGKITSRNEGGESEELESLYDQYREEIIQRQNAQASPPPLHPNREHLQPSVSPPPLKADTPSAYSAADIQKARLSKLKTAEPVTLATTTPKTRRPKDATAIRKKIRSKDGLRQAIIARQILGPPRGLAEHKL